MCLAGWLVAGVSACGVMPSEVRGTFVGARRVDITITVPPGHEDERERDMYAALTTLKILGAWLPPFADSTLTISANGTRWWTADAAMTPEYAVARAVSRQYWERAIDTRALPPWFLGGLVEYCARRAVSKIVDERYLAVYRSRAEARYFGGFVPRDLRIPLRVEDQGEPIDAYRARPRGRDRDALQAKSLLTLGTLERWVGRPVFDEIIAAFAHEGGQPSLDSFARLASRISGQDLRWFFAQTLEGDGVIDYAISALSSDVQPDGWYKTTVAVHRLGDGIFSGANGGSDDLFEHGRGVVVATTFADGESVRDAWDGRSSARIFEYRSRSRAVSAEVDPDRVLLLDLNRGNNGVTLDSEPGRTAATRWAARWMMWLEDALLTYVAFT
jgi:hypothetical protein